MKLKWNTFLRILSSYTIEEKVVSLLVGFVLLFLFVSGIYDFIKNPGFFSDYDGTYTEGILTDKPVVLNPLYVDFSDANREVSSLVFSGLTKYNPELKVFVGDIADLMINKEGTTYSFKIKKNVYWHDGELLTADDVYFTFNDVIQHPDFQNPVLKANFDGVEVKKTGSDTVEFVLKKPNSFFITNLNVGILPKHLLSDVSVEDLPYDNFNFHPVGTGPYKVIQPIDTTNDGRQRIFLTLNEDFYGDLPTIKNVRFHVYMSSDLMIKEKGTVNVISKVSKDIMSAIDESNRFWIINYELPQYTAVFLNMNNEFLKNKKVRLALQKSIDKNKLLELLPNKTPVDTPLMDLDQEDWLYKPNLEEASGALFDSGYKWDKNSGDEYRKKSDGSNFKFVLLVRKYEKGSSNFEDMEKVVNFLVDSWKDVGVEIEVQFVDSSDFSVRVKNRDYDILVAGESLGYNLDTYSYWHSSQADGNGLNLSNYKSFVADSLIEKIRKTFELEEKESLLKDLAKEISEEIPAIFLYRPSYIFATDNKVKNINLDNLSFPNDRFANIKNWCINC